jgi:hypothetical protein
MAPEPVRETLEGTGVQYLATRLRRLVSVRCGERSADWWAYLGSFGDDFFGDDE